MVKNYGSTSKKYIYSRYTQDPKFQLWYQRLNHVWNVRWFSLVSPMDTHLIWVGPNNVNKKRPKVRGINEPIGFQKHEGHKSRLGWFRIETPNLLVTLVFKYIQISRIYSISTILFSPIPREILQLLMAMLDQNPIFGCVWTRVIPLYPNIAHQNNIVSYGNWWWIIAFGGHRVAHFQTKPRLRWNHHQA